MRFDVLMAAKTSVLVWRVVTSCECVGRKEIIASIFSPAVRMCPFERIAVNHGLL
jgi:hypothetical protein